MMSVQSNASGDIQRQIERLQNAMQTLDGQRAMLGDAVVNPAIAALRAQLAPLEQQAQSAPAPDERCIVTALFCDIVGSTALAEKMDPEDWQAVAAQVHATTGGLVHHHHGQVIQYLGDGLLALFGAQAPSEFDAENAVRAALDIQQAMAKRPNSPSIQLRIGIHTGLVLLGNIGAEDFRQFSALGDAMNLAARLQTAAPPGGVLISHDTYQQVRGAFECAKQPPLLVKGKSEPVQTYIVQRARQRSFQMEPRGVAGIATRTIGRKSELEFLRSALVDALSSRRLVWAQLLGEPGLGKSRLLAEVRTFAMQSIHNLFILQARAMQGEEKQAYGLVRRFWFDRFQISDDAPLAEAESRWQDAFLALGGPGGMEAAHALGLLVGLPFHDSPHIGAMRVDPEQVKGRAIAVSRELMGAIRARAPILILLEDLHWADASSWDYLQQVVLSEGDADYGLCVIAAARPEWHAPEMLKRDAVYRPLELSALSEQASRELVLALLGHVAGVPNDVITLIVTRSEGVPYYAEEIVNWLLDRDIIDRTCEPWQFNAERLLEAPLPTTLQHLLLTRLGSLQAIERVVLQHGAVFGRNFWEGGLAALGDADGSSLLAPLQTRGFVDLQAQSSLEGEREWAFHHVLLRDVAYESILKRERRSLHRSAGQWLEAQARRAGRLDEIVGILSDHAERAGETGTAAGWLLRAGDQAKARGAYQEARTFYERALDLLPSTDWERRWRAHLGRNDVVSRLGDRVAQQESLSALGELSVELGDEHRAVAHYREALWLDHTGEYQAALQYYDSALASANRTGKPSLAASILGSKVICQHRIGDMPGASQSAQEVLGRVHDIEESEAVPVLVNVAVYYVESGDLAQAALLHRSTAEIVHRLGDRAREANTLTNLGYDYVCLGMPDLARSSLETAIHLYRAIGSRRELAYAQLNLALAHWRIGDSRAARRVLEALQDELAALGDKFARAAGINYLALAMEHAGETTTASVRFAEAREQFSAMGVFSLAADALASLARCALAEGQRDVAMGRANELWAYLQEHGAQGMEFPIWAYLTCADLFSAASDTYRERAAIENGLRELKRRAEKISDAAWQDSFLDNVPEHRIIRQRMQNLAGVSEADRNIFLENKSYGVRTY